MKCVIFGQANELYCTLIKASNPNTAAQSFHGRFSVKLSKLHLNVYVSGYALHYVHSLRDSDWMYVSYHICVKLSTDDPNLMCFKHSCKTKHSLVIQKAESD